MKEIKTQVRKSYFSPEQDFSEDFIYSNCEKIDFLYPCMLTSTIMIPEMGVNSLSCGPLGQQKRDSITDLIFIP